MLVSALAPQPSPVGQDVEIQEIQLRGQWIEAEVLRMMPDGQSVQVRIRQNGRSQAGVAPLRSVRIPNRMTPATPLPPAAPRRPTVSFQPFIQTVDVVIDDENVWTRQTQTGPPPVLFSKEGQSTQQAASQYEKPVLEMFEKTNLPPRLVRPKFLAGWASHSSASAGRSRRIDLCEASIVDLALRRRSSEDGFMTDTSMDRGRVHVTSLQLQGEKDGAAPLSPAEGLAAMWQLAVDAWAFCGEDVAQSRFQRHVVRVVRGRG